MPGSTAGISYPASFTSDYRIPAVDNMHSTLIFLGPKEQVNALAVRQAVSRVLLPSAQYVDVIGTDHFGPEKDVPVLLLEPTTLLNTRYLVERDLARIGVRSPSEFGYRPHVSVDDAVLQDPPDRVLLGRPQIWWGEFAFAL